MAGTDDQPDGEGPGPEPDPDSGPDDGPTPDDADPPVPDDDGEPEPDDEGDPPDDGRPDRHRRSRLELVTVALAAVGVALTAVALIVGSVLSYLSVVASKDAVVVAKDALDDSREAESEELHKDLSRVSFRFRRDGERLLLEIYNRSSRPIRPIKITYDSYIVNYAGESVRVNSDSLPFGTEPILESCDQLSRDVLGTQSTDPRLGAPEDDWQHIAHTLEVDDLLSANKFIVTTYSSVYQLIESEIPSRAEDRGSVGPVSVRRIENC